MPVSVTLRKLYSHTLRQLSDESREKSYESAGVCKERLLNVAKENRTDFNSLLCQYFQVRLISMITFW